MLAWENNKGERATLSKNRSASALELLELHCVDPELAAIDTFSMPAGKLRSVIEQLPQEQPYVPMGENATLCGYECLPTQEGGLLINLVWKLKPELTKRRVLNFLFVRRVMKGPEERLFLDQLSIPPEKCKGARIITVGFWDEQAKQMVQIENGETLAKGTRLVIGRINHVD